MLTATVNTMAAASSQMVSGAVRPNRFRAPLASIVASMVVILSLGKYLRVGSTTAAITWGRTEAVISLLGLPVHPGGRARFALARAA